MEKTPQCVTLLSATRHATSVCKWECSERFGNAASAGTADLVPILLLRNAHGPEHSARVMDSLFITHWFNDSVETAELLMRALTSVTAYT